MSRFRNLTLGQVIKATYEARDAHWVPTGHLSAPTRERQQASPAKPAAKGGKPPLAKPIAGRAVARDEGWHCAMPGFPTWAMQGGAVMPERPAQVRCDPQRRPSLRDAESRSQGVSGGKEVLRVPWGGGGLPHRVRTLAP